MSDQEMPKVPGAPGGDAQSEFVMRYGGPPRGEKGEPGEKGDRGDAMTASARRAVIFLFGFAVLLAVLNFSWTVQQVNSSQAKWCTTMDLLTAHPVPKPADPKSNPSREQIYQYYVTFRELRRNLGCG